MDEKSLSHTKWNCKYHIVLVPKYRSIQLRWILQNWKIQSWVFRLWRILLYALAK